MKIRPGFYLSIIDKIAKNRIYKKIEKIDGTELVKQHFNYWSNLNHINVPAFLLAIKALGERPAVIVETGTSAWGTDSTRLWDHYVELFGGKFYSIDIRRDASLELFGQMSKNTSLVVSDSVKFLEKNSQINADLYFLDSWDLDLDNPILSALHGMQEFMAIKSNLQSGTVLFIDDTPSSDFLKTIQIPLEAQNFIDIFGFPPGKGAFVKKYLDIMMPHKVLHHYYSYLVKID